MSVVSPVMVLFFLMLTGFIAAKLKILGPQTIGYFSTFLIYVPLPALLFTSLLRPFSHELLREAGFGFLLSVLMYALAFLVAFIFPRLFRIKGPARGIYRYAIIISNCGYIGYPMVSALLGEEYVFHAVIFNIPFSILAFSVCAWLVSKEGKEPLRLSWKTFVNQNIIAVLLGLLCFVCSFSLPEPLFRSLKMTGDICSPLSMIMIGATLAQAKASQIFGRWEVYVTIVVRLLVFPALAGIVVYLLGVRGPLFYLVILIASMPAGATTSTLATLYNIAPNEASSLVFLSTMLCVITVPLVISCGQFFLQ